MGSKTSLLTFFVINSTCNYNAFLGRDWIHTTWCVSSSLHQLLLFWKNGEEEMVWANKKNSIATLDSIEASYYDQECGLIKFKGKRMIKLQGKYAWS